VPAVGVGVVALDALYMQHCVCVALDARGAAAAASGTGLASQD
jgi:hypothetical protein